MYNDTLDTPVTKYDNIPKAAQRILELTPVEARRLFDYNFPYPFDIEPLSGKAGADTAAQRIEFFIASNGTDDFSKVDFKPCAKTRKK